MIAFLCIEKMANLVTYRIGVVTAGLRSRMRASYILYTNTVLDGSVILSVILFVPYRNHFPVVQFQNQAHIRNTHGPGQVYK